MKKHPTIGLIGLDSSRSLAFAELLGARRASGVSCKADIVMACTGPVSRCERDAERSLAHARELQTRWGVTLVDHPEAVARACDWLFLLSADARDRGWCFDNVVDAGKPKYLEKSLAESAGAARVMLDRAARSGALIYSASCVRFAPGWANVKHALIRNDVVTAVELLGPTPPHDTLPSPMWYGIHLADLAIDALGVGWDSIGRTVTDEGETTVVSWKDGRAVTLRGYRTGPTRYTAIMQQGEQTTNHDLGYEPRACNAGLLNAIHDRLAAGKQDPATSARMVEVVRLVEAMADADTLTCNEAV